MRTLKVLLFIAALSGLTIFLYNVIPVEISQPLIDYISKFILFTCNFCAEQASKIYHYMLTLFGTILICIFSPTGRGDKSTRPFLQRMFRNKDDIFYDRADFFITIIFGSIFGYILFMPETAIRAISAGIGWGATFSTLNKMGGKSIPEVHHEKIALPDTIFHEATSHKDL